jgi:hypothetical protein
MGLLPDMLVFRKMQELLRDISQILEHGNQGSEPFTFNSQDSAIKDRCSMFVDNVKAEDPARELLAVRIYNEIYNQTLQLGPPYEEQSKEEKS